MAATIASNTSAIARPRPPRRSLSSAVAASAARRRPNQPAEKPLRVPGFLAGSTRDAIICILAHGVQGIGDLALGEALVHLTALVQQLDVCQRFGHGEP